jgi:flagellar motor switch protein FliG
MDSDPNGWEQCDSGGLTRAQKAAAILVAMGKPAAGRLLKFFTHEELKALIEAARMLKTIPQSELERIIAEFEDEFAEGAGLMDSAATMDRILSESLSPEEMNALMRHGAPDEEGEPHAPVWPALEKLEPVQLGEFLAGEMPQTAALVLTNLSSPIAANVLITLPKPMRGEVMKRMVTTHAVKPKALRIVENQIRRKLLSDDAPRPAVEGHARVATVLNELDKPQLDELLADMESAGSRDVTAIRSHLFSFEDVVLLTQKSRLLLFDQQPSELVTLALRGAGRELTEAVLSAIGVRSRRMIESELGSDAPVSSADITKAQRAIAAAAIRLAKEGLIQLPSTQVAA